VPRPSVAANESHVTAIRTHRIDLIILIPPVGGECDHAPVRRPCRPSIKGWVVRNISWVGAVSIRHKHFRVRLAEHSAERHHLPVRRPHRIGVNPICKQLRNAVGRDVDRVDLGWVFARRREVVVGTIQNAVAISSPARVDRLQGSGSERLDTSSVRVHEVNLLEPIFYQHERNTTSIRGPCRVLVISIIAGELAHIGAVHRSAHQLLPPCDHHDVDHFLAVARECRIHDGGVTKLIRHGSRAVLRWSSRM